MKKSILKVLVGAASVVAVLVQFVSVDRGNPAVQREIRWASEETREMARRACYDCHSNETRWPWYSAVAPVSWLVAKDVAEGREHLNFSEWDQPNEDAHKILEVVEEGEMPLRKYLLLHPGARLDGEERRAFLEGLRETLAGDPPVEHSDGEEGH